MNKVEHPHRSVYLVCGILLFWLVTYLAILGFLIRATHNQQVIISNQQTIISNQETAMDKLGINKE